MTLYDNPILTESLFSIGNVKEAKRRKDMLQTHFSKAAVVRSERMISDRIEIFLQILKAAASDNNALDLSPAFSCLAADITSQFCYRRSFGAIDTLGFLFLPILAMEQFMRANPHAWCFPNLFVVIQKILNLLPLGFLEHYTGQFGATACLQRRCREQIDVVKTQRRQNSPELEPTIFDTISNPDKSKGQYTPSDIGLQGDACLIFVAGVDTTSNTLVQGSWRIMNSLAVLEKLQNELLMALPSNCETTLSLVTLQELSYLQAAIKESLRFSHGVPGRMPRIVPTTCATFCRRSIPPGTSVNHSAYVYHSDESLFKDATSFSPERWLANNSYELDGKLLSFSKGTRACPGMKLANCILATNFAQLFLNFHLSPNNTTDAEIEWDDCFTSQTRGHSKVSLPAILSELT